MLIELTYGNTTQTFSSPDQANERWNQLVKAGVKVRVKGFTPYLDDNQG